MSGETGGIVRVVKNGGYTVLDNTASQDERLSFKAVGIHTYLMTKPDNWQVYSRQLSGTHTDGRDSVLAGLKELEEAGYLVRRRVQNEQGQFTGYESVVYECPQNTDTDDGKTVNRKTRIPVNPASGKARRNKDLLPIIPDLKQSLTLPGWLPEEAWADFLQHRKVVKAPVTPLAATRLIRTLTELREQGNDPVRVIDQTISTGKWTGLFPLSQKGSAPAANGTTRAGEAAHNPFAIKVEPAHEAVDW